MKGKVDHKFEIVLFKKSYLNQNLKMVQILIL